MTNPYISKTISIDITKGIRGLYEVNTQLREEGFDAVFDLHNNHRTRLLRKGISNNMHIIRKETFKRFALVHFHQNYFRSIEPLPERHVATAKEFGIVSDSKGPELFLPDDISEQTLRRLTDSGWKKGCMWIALCPGSKHFTKRWPEERFTELQEILLRNPDICLLILGGGEDVDLAGRLVGDRTDGRIVNFIGKLTLLETACAMDQCDVVVANDSGLMHMATARNIPVVALFGSTVREFGFFPYNSNSHILQVDGLSCRPCSHLGRASCPKKHFRCMTEIDADHVAASVFTLLHHK